MIGGDQIRSLPVNDTYHAHANKNGRYLRIVLIPESPRSDPPKMRRAQQREFQQSTQSGLQEIRREYNPRAPNGKIPGNLQVKRYYCSRKVTSSLFKVCRSEAAAAAGRF